MLIAYCLLLIADWSRIIKKAFLNHAKFKKKRLKLLLGIYRLSNVYWISRVWWIGLRGSRAQLFQELFVLSALDFEVGYFVEVGGTDGILLSNTMLLEKAGWQGVIFEPCKSWHDSLKSNRGCHLDFRAVTNLDGETILFSETSIPELSTITSEKPQDGWAGNRELSLDYLVETISLTTALKELHFPHSLDFLSVDTEGSELNVFRGLDLSIFSFKVITVERAEDLEKGMIIKTMLEDHGYHHVFKGETFWDDWYLHEQLFTELVSAGRLKSK
jgi:FkbM family methyltransferase